MRQKIWICLVCWFAWGCQADELVSLSVRQGQSVSYWWMPNTEAQGTVLLFSGGSGGIGYRDGQPQSNNFLIRSRQWFRSQGFHVALMGNPSDKRQLDDAWRTSDEHLTDVQAVLADVRRRASQPIWLVGTSRGTISVAALGARLQDSVAGLVLTASMTSFQVPASLPRLALDQIRVPVLIYHHQRDACRLTQPDETVYIERGLSRASVVRRWIVSGGSEPSGHECEALHWHGFIGMEEQAVRDLAGWMRDPRP